MQFAGSLVGAFIAVIGALLVGYILARHERLTQQRDQRQRILQDIIVDSERNLYQLDTNRDQADYLRIEDPQVWSHSDTETGYWWEHRGHLDFLNDDVRQKLRSCVYNLDGLNRVIADLRDRKKLGNLRDHIDYDRLNDLKEENQEVLNSLQSELERVSQTELFRKALKFWAPASI